MHCLDLLPGHTVAFQSSADWLRCHGWPCATWVNTAGPQNKHTDDLMSQGALPKCCVSCIVLIRQTCRNSFPFGLRRHSVDCKCYGNYKFKRRQLGTSKANTICNPPSLTRCNRHATLEDILLTIITHESCGMQENESRLTVGRLDGTYSPLAAS